MSNEPTWYVSGALTAISLRYPSYRASIGVHRLVTHLSRIASFLLIACIWQLLSATWYMHQEGIVHRDLKLENVVYESKKPDSDIFIIDYGLSKVKAAFVLLPVSTLHDKWLLWCLSFSFRSHDPQCPFEFSRAALPYRLL